MFINQERELKFIEAEEKHGTSQKTGKPYSIRKIKFADPLTFENLIVDYKEGLDLRGFSRGQDVSVTLELRPNYNNQAIPLVIGMLPFKK